MVEEYVKDMYRIGLILLFSPFAAAMLLWIALAVLGQTMDEVWSAAIPAAAVQLSGLLILLYVSIKYYYKEGRYGKKMSVLPAGSAVC